MENNNIWGMTSVYKAIIAVGIFLSIFLIVVSIQGLKSLGTTEPAMTSISIQGKGEIVAVPDVATFTFSVYETAKTISEAQNLATDKLNKALAVIQESGISKEDTKTLSYNMSPKYESETIYCIKYPCPQPAPKLTGYDVNQTIEVKVRDITKVGSLFQKVADANIGNVGSLQFTVEDRDILKDQARTKALEDARIRANAVAKALGVKIVRVVSYYDNNNEAYPQMYSAKVMNMDTRAGAPAPEIPAGEQKITSDVSVTYEIK